MRSPGRQRRPPETAYRAAFGAHVRLIREERGVSQHDLADQVDMSPRHYGGIERGQANVTLDLLVRLAAGLGVEPAEMMPKLAETLPSP